VIDLERRDFLGIQGLGEDDADRLLQLIDELTVVEGDAAGDDDEQGDEGAAGGEARGEPKSRGTAVASGPQEGDREQRSE
jgi:hypothetical protein